MTIGMDESDLPEFAVIKEIIICNGSKIIFVSKRLNVHRFDHHYHAYQVSKRIPEEILSINHDNLHDFIPLSLLTCGDLSMVGINFVVPRYNIHWDK